MKFLLLPFMWLFVLITKFRNFLYDKNILKTTYFDFPIINVGNLTVGGTGKTPHVEFLVRFFLESFNDEYQINVLSRGYGRKTKGFLLANDTTSATEIGDEPQQYFEKFGDKINVVVCENRVLGATLIQDLIQDLGKNLHQKNNQNNQKQNLIILDDAFQHRAIGRNVDILLTDYKRLFYDDFPFPVGRLREQRKNAQRADFVVVSKCFADISKNEMNKIQAHIQAYTGAEKPVFFTKITYGNPINLISNLEENFMENTQWGMPHCQNPTIILLSGIAQPQLFEDFCKENFPQKHTIKNHFIFPDHHQYTQKNITKISVFIENLEEKNIQNIKILTTEKDAVNLRKLLPQKLESIFYYLPIMVDFIEKKEDFLQLLVNKMTKNN